MHLREFARFLKVGSGPLHRWMWGDRLPDVTNAVRIEQVLDIPVRLWAEPPSKAMKSVLAGFS